MVIRFYNPREEYGCFSNFSRHPITLDDKLWPTSEHYFQAQKFPSEPKYQEEMRNVLRPSEVAQMGRDRSHQLRPDWEQVKDDYMRLAVLQKFVEHPDIRGVLVSTGDEELIEATTGDYYWGEGTEKTGKNMLGVILMEVRDVLSSQDRYSAKSDEKSSKDPLTESRIVKEYRQALLERLGK